MKNKKLKKKIAMACAIVSLLGVAGSGAVNASSSCNRSARINEQFSGSCVVAYGSRRATNTFEMSRFRVFSHVGRVSRGSASSAHARARVTNGIVTAWSPSARPGSAASIRANRLPLIRPATAGWVAR